MYWAAAQIRASERTRVLWRIERQGFEHYLPMCRPTRRSLRVQPLFVGYVFIRIIDRWRCLLGTQGVIGLIRSGDSPAVVREEEIDRIKAQEARDGTIILPLTRFQPGEKVRVLRGPLHDQIGVVHAGMTARQRVAVLFSMFEREVQVELAERDLTAV
jgi:transcription termination/antitermination protein NusG